MEKNQIFFGRNVFIEALNASADISEILVANDSAKKFAEAALGKFKRRIRISQGIPSPYRSESHQGILFKTQHSFYIDPKKGLSKEFPRVVFCNHIEDPQNLGSIIRASAAFGFNLIIHENRRSSRLSPTVVKASAGLAFRIKFHETANLATLCRFFKDEGYWLYGLEAGAESKELYQWHVQSPMVLALGAEGDGLSNTLVAQLDELVRISMVSGVDSLNVAQAGSIAMSWASSKTI